MTATVRFGWAGKSQSAAIAALVNAAYRGEGSRLGWTTEADFLSGQRTDGEMVEGLMDDAGSRFLVAWAASGLVACAHLHREGDSVWLGMLAVQPVLQGQGIGTALIGEAEGRAMALWGARRMRMCVLGGRDDLLAFYGRRGYRPTGERRPFPRDPRFGIPRVADLHFRVLEKPLGG